jgi:hypothetical protein
VKTAVAAPEERRPLRVLELEDAIRRAIDALKADYLDSTDEAIDILEEVMQ